MNRYVFIHSFVPTRKSLLDSLKALTPGEKWTTTTVLTTDMEKEHAEKSAKKDPAGGYILLKILSWKKGTTCGFALHKDENTLLGLPKEDMVEVMRSVLIPKQEAP